MQDNTYEEIGPAVGAAIGDAQKKQEDTKPSGVGIPLVSAAKSSVMTASTTTDSGLKERRPDEPAFRLGIDPSNRIIFSSNDLGEVAVHVTVVLKNPTASKQAFKIKCTDNRIFRIVPAYGFIEIGETIEVQLIFMGRKVPKDDLHFFTFYHCAAQFKVLKKRRFHPMDPDGVKRILVVFRGSDGMPFKKKKPKEKKDKKKKKGKK